jgi:hypothetical protein
MKGTDTPYIKSAPNDNKQIQTTYAKKMDSIKFGNSLLKRNEVLAKELGKIKEINRRLREKIQDLLNSQLFLESKHTCNAATQTEKNILPASMYETPEKKKNSVILLLSQLSISKSIERSELLDLETSDDSLFKRFPDEYFESSYLSPIVLKNENLKFSSNSSSSSSSSSSIQNNINSKIDSNQIDTIRKSLRTPITNNIISYQEPSLRVKIRKGFKFFKRIAKNSCENCDHK